VHNFCSSDDGFFFSYLSKICARREQLQWAIFQIRIFCDCYVVADIIITYGGAYLPFVAVSLLRLLYYFFFLHIIRLLDIKRVNYIYELAL